MYANSRKIARSWTDIQRLLEKRKQLGSGERGRNTRAVGNVPSHAQEFTKRKTRENRSELLKLANQRYVNKNTYALLFVRVEYEQVRSCRASCEPVLRNSWSSLVVNGDSVPPSYLDPYDKQAPPIVCRCGGTRHSGKYRP